MRRSANSSSSPTAAIRSLATNTGESLLELMLLGGAIAEGPLVFHGPFVMNSVEQVRAAELAFRTGRLGTLEKLPEERGHSDFARSVAARGKSRD